MHRKFWFLVAAAVAVFALTGSVAGSAAAGSHIGYQWKGGTSLAASLAANRTPAQRQVNDTVNFGMEQDAGGFNLANENFTGAWAAYFGETPVILGNYIINQNGAYVLDLAASVKATSTYLHINIKPGADWHWYGHSPATFPVTADDYIWTWQQLVLPGNNVASTAGYSLIYKAVKNGTKSVTFYWHKPFADFKDLFGYIYPKIAVDSVPWNTMWADCVCGYDGAGNEQGPISNGPFYLDSWTPGSGLVLKANHAWYGDGASTGNVNTINGLIRNAGATANNALLAGEIDAIFPGLPTGVDSLMSHPGISHVIKSGFTQEHMDVEFGPTLTAAGGTHTDNGAYLLKRAWFDQALAESLNRQGVINAIYGSLLGNNTIKPLNNPFYTIGTKATAAKYQYFKPYNYAPAKAIALLKANGCTGGPNQPTNTDPNNIWTCGPQTTAINFYTTTASARCAVSRPVWEQNALAVGIRLDSHCYTAQPDFFTNLLPTGAFDLAEYAFTGGPDPSGWDAIYQCVTATTGGQNYKNYCNPKVDAFIKKGDSELNPTARTADYQNAANLVSQNVAIIPLYARPAMIFYNSNLDLSLSDNPTSVGPLWNAQNWTWS
jgi:ABC-type transport system substrate-binding protein